MATCLLVAGCSGGEKVSSAPVQGDENGLVEIPSGDEGTAAGPAINAMTPGGKGPRGAAATP